MIEELLLIVLIMSIFFMVTITKTLNEIAERVERIEKKINELRYKGE